MIRVGVHEILLEGFKNGCSQIAIWSAPFTIYQRKDGSYFFRAPDGGRETITRRSDGSFYQAYYS